MEVYESGIVASEVIYFDPDDYAMDGLGWNWICGGSAFAYRYATREEAIRAAFE